MADFDKQYGFSTDETAREFHKKRRMFVINDGELIIAPEGSDLSHAEWFKQLGFISEEDTSLMEKLVRGYVNQKGDIYFYTGFDFRITPEVEQEFFNHLANLKIQLNLGVDIRIYGGTKEDGHGDRVGIKQYS